jgi:hypothetical protein
VQRATWTDERLDDLARSIDRRFEQVDLRFLLAAIIGGIATGAIGG